MKVGLVGKIVILTLIIGCIQSENENSDIELEFDQTNIKSLKLTIRWRFKSNTNRNATKYILFYEIGRVNVFNNYAIEYSTPELLDDEEVVKASTMRRENFKNRAEFNFVSSYNCSLNCLNSTNVLAKSPFECNLFSYDPSVRKCVIYEYDYYNKYVPKTSYRRKYDEYEIYDYFMDECDMDEFFIEFAGYTRMCRRIMEYRDEHSVIIRPFVDFRFSISLRDSENKWTPFLRKEFQYSPSVTVEIIGDLKFGQNVKLKCKTDLSNEVVESISWRNSGSTSDTLALPHFSPYNLHQSYYCEIRIGSKQMIQKAFRFDMKNLKDDLRPELKLNQKVNEQELTVDLNWNIEPPQNTKFVAEKILLLYSENGHDYKFPKKYFPFQNSRWQSANFPFNKDNKFFNTTNEEECAKLCIQESFCNHFVFKYQIEPYWADRFQSNCRLSSKTAEGFFPCPKFASCQNLKLPESYVSNNSVKISILPNVTYKFKLQVRDKYLNWTNSFETTSFFVPLSISAEKMGSERVTGNSTFSLKCLSNIFKVNKIIWTRNDEEISLLNKMYTQRESSENQYLNSILNFNMKNRQNLSEFSGKYKCKIIRDSDVSGFVGYFSEPVDVNLTLNDSLNFIKLNSNISLPTLPGIYLSLDCHVTGSSIESLDWFVNGELINNRNKFFNHDDILVIASKSSESLPLVNRTLILKLEESKPSMKYECKLNQNEIIRSHFIEIINQKPEIDVQIDKSELNKLKLSFHIETKKMHDQFQNLDNNPLKLSILYAENSTINTAFLTYIAPGTLSKSSNLAVDKFKIENLIGHLLRTEHSLQSCKLTCFQTPLCHSYEYLLYDDSCNFYSTPKAETFYHETIDKIKQANIGSDMMLVHMQDDAPRTLEEAQLYNFTILMDKKSYSYCENRTANSFNEESYCRDEIADFKETYTMENLTPLTTYQFRIEISNAFGVSKPLFSQIIQVPFKLNKIVQHEISNENKLFKLECSTNLIQMDKLKFVWFRERDLIKSENKNFSQNDIIDSNVFKTELVFHGDIHQFIGHYTCQLIYESPETRLVTNVSHLFVPKIPPVFSDFEQVKLVKNEGDTLSENCSANGWPLPELRWFYKDRPLDDDGQHADGFPHSSYHHRNMTAMSYLFGSDLKKNYEGVYSCMLNDLIPIKNVTLTIGDGSDKNFPSEDSKSQPSKKENKNSNILVNGLIGVFVVLALGIIGGSFYFLKKKKSDNNALMSYNRIEEELMTGVDNVNLTDDTQ